MTEITAKWNGESNHDLDDVRGHEETLRFLGDTSVGVGMGDCGCNHMAIRVTRVILGHRILNITRTCGHNIFPESTGLVYRHVGIVC